MTTDTATSDVADSASVMEKSLPETVAWVLPLLKEYAEKLNRLGEQTFQVGQIASARSVHLTHVIVPEVARIVCQQETLVRRVQRVASVASGLLEHAPVDHETKLELGLRLDETEDGLRCSTLQVEHLVAYVKEVGWLGELRKQIEKSGRMKSPV